MGPNFYVKHFRLFYAGNQPNDVLSVAEKRFQRFLSLYKSKIFAARFLMGPQFLLKLFFLFYAGNQSSDVLSDADKVFQRFLSL